MSRLNCCGSPEHGLNRRQFLRNSIASSLGVALGGLGADCDLAWADELQRQHKRVLLLWLAGGASQLETWDPKPGRVTGGPFQAIPTAVPGIHICELMPKMAALMNRVGVVRSLDTKIADHGTAAAMMETGRRREPAIQHADMGSVVARELAQRDADTPSFVSLYLATEGHRRPDPGFLGGRYAAMHLNKSLRPENVALPDGLSDAAHSEREDLRRFLTDRFDRERNAPAIKGYNNVYARVRGLMKSDSLFDLDQEPAKVRDDYGPTDFGQHALIARRLIEAGVPMVKVARAWWDSHADNFESHRELVSELDHVMSTLLRDLDARGLLQSTLVITLSEFGRTPDINKNVGRDHFASAWSCSFSGCGIQGGTVHGKTDDDGRTVSDGKVAAGDVVATIYRAVGIDPKKEYQVGERPVPIVPEDARPIATVLA